MTAATHTKMRHRSRWRRRPARSPDVGQPELPQPAEEHAERERERGHRVPITRRRVEVVMPGPGRAGGRGGGPRARCGASTAPARRPPRRSPNSSPSDPQDAGAGALVGQERAAPRAAVAGRRRRPPMIECVDESSATPRKAWTGTVRSDEQQPGRDGGAAPACGSRPTTATANSVPTSTKWTWTPRARGRCAARARRAA